MAGRPAPEAFGRAIIAASEAGDSIDIGIDAIGSIPVIVVGTIIALVALSMSIVRSATRRPITVTLRGAA